MRDKNIEPRLRELGRTGISELIDEWVMNSRDREVIRKRLIDGVFFEPLAEQFDLSVRQVKRIVYKAEEQIFKHI